VQAQREGVKGIRYRLDGICHAYLSASECYAVYIRAFGYQMTISARAVSA
jgi:hypothetical protein